MTSCFVKPHDQLLASTARLGALGVAVQNSYPSIAPNSTSSASAASASLSDAGKIEHEYRSFRLSTPPSADQSLLVPPPRMTDSASPASPWAIDFHHTDALPAPPVKSIIAASDLVLNREQLRTEAPANVAEHSPLTPIRRPQLCQFPHRLPLTSSVTSLPAYVPRYSVHSTIYKPATPAPSYRVPDPAESEYARALCEDSEINDDGLLLKADQRLCDYAPSGSFNGAGQEDDELFDPCYGDDDDLDPHDGLSSAATLDEVSPKYTKMLAAQAAELLSSLGSEQQEDEKFKNSKFLAFLADVRDEKVSFEK
ncbi:hypothetical protein SJAG_03565 [Schizosaccharomyces japonicus yFS275]|uniref:Uncharacterized protein n=1 Tax=Schizosaccharomyces japonicus (strain yFS275 / FY16936) TaxID=402676 RepID=B6K4K3_SCHJY|nr:hypothetical protein SJAG_03565 [Schizosaccharomyces japonicus yFS275]EEB08410.1 hypothetical protein SJAG_03565 [Schizosaccharomyces japonicus yFS275]